MNRLIRKRVTALVGLAILLTIVLILAAYLRFDAADFQRLLVSQIERRLDCKVTFSAVDVDVWPPFGLRLSHLSVSSPAPEPGPPFMTVKALTVSIWPIPLLVGRFSLREITLEEPVLTMTRDRAGKMSLGRIGKRPETESEEAKEPLAIARQIFVTKTNVTRGTLTFVDHFAGETPVTTRLEKLNVEAKNLAFGREPQLRVEAETGLPLPGGRFKIEGTAGELRPGMSFRDLPLDLELSARRLDLKPFGRYLPVSLKKNIRSGILNTDLSISGSVDAGLTLKGNIRMEQADLGESAFRLAGTILSDVDWKGGEGITRGKVKMRLAPGTFSKGSLSIDGDAEVRSTFRMGSGDFHSQIQIDATDATYGQGAVFQKKPGTTLTVAGSLSRGEDGFRVGDAQGKLGDLDFTGSAEIGRPARPGSSPPMGLHFSPDEVDLSSLDQYLSATAPYGIRGTAQVERLDILRRPGEAREWQVTIDMRLADVSLEAPLADGRAHSAEDLAAKVLIVPGLLKVDEGRAKVNGVPLSFRGEADEFMSILSRDPGRKRADVRLDAWERSVDLDRLLKPARTPSASEDGASSAEAEGEVQPEPPETTTATGETPPGVPSAENRPFLERFVVARGEIRAEKALYARQPISQLRAAFTYDHPVLRLEETDFGAVEGNWWIDGSVALGDEPDFDLNVKASHARVEMLIQAFSKSEKPASIFGILDGGARLHGRGRGVTAWEKTLKGAGRVTIRDGRLPSFNLFEAIIRAVFGIFSRILPVAKLRSFSQATTFRQFDQDFEIGDGRVRTDDLQLITDDYHLTGKGSFGLDRTLDYETEAALTPQGTQKLITLASVPILNKAFGQLPPIPVRVTGNFEKPVIRPEVSVVSLGGLGDLLGGVGGAGQAVETGADIIKGGVDRLLGRSQKRKGEEGEDEQGEERERAGEQEKERETP